MTTTSCAAESPVPRDGEKDEAGTLCHHLFLPQTEDDPLVFPTFISIVRTDERGRHIDTSGGVLPAGDLLDVAALHARYGGGFYEVYARDARTRVMARRKIGPLPGRPKPLSAAYADDDDEPMVPTPIAAAPMKDDNTALIAAMMQSNREFMASMLERSEKASADALARQEKSSERMFGMAMELVKTTKEAPAAAAAAAVAAQASPMEQFFAGVEFAKTLHSEISLATAKPDTDSVTETLELLSKGMEVVDKLQKGGAPPSSNGNAA